MDSASQRKQYYVFLHEITPGMQNHNNMISQWLRTTESPFKWRVVSCKPGPMRARQQQVFLQVTMETAASPRRTTPHPPSGLLSSLAKDPSGPSFLILDHCSPERSCGP